MEYNTQKKKLILPEYGRNIQTMVSHLLTIKDRDERTKAAKIVIDVMGNLYPHLRDIPDFRHKLWDHLAIMSNFSLDIDTPYPLPLQEKLNEKPRRIPYSTNRIKFRHYGKIAEKLAEKIREIPDKETRDMLFLLTANHMKRSYIIWNKNSVEDEDIINDLCGYIGSTEFIPQNISLSSTKEFSQKKTKNSQNKNRTNPQKGGKPYYNRKKTDN